MSREPAKANRQRRPYPKLIVESEGNYRADCPPDFNVEKLMGMRIHDTAHGVYTTAISALGKSVEKFASLGSAMFADTGRHDAFEAMLVAQMSATHVAMTTLIERMTYQQSYQVPETTGRGLLAAK